MADVVVDSVVASALGYEAAESVRAVQDAYRNQKLTDYLKRLSARQGRVWILDHTYLTRHGNYKAVITYYAKRKVLRWSQERWKECDT